MASTAEAERTQIYGSLRASHSMFREQTPIQGKDQSWSLNQLVKVGVTIAVTTACHEGFLIKLLPSGNGGSECSEAEAENPPSWNQRVAKRSDPAKAS